MNLPLVSIVVNNYNNELFLEDCLDSLMAQTYRNIEIVVVDAFSSDNSRKVLDAYADRDDRIKLIYAESHVQFPAITYNLGFLNCSGDFIAINDADDMSMPPASRSSWILAGPSGHRSSRVQLCGIQ